MTEAINEMLRKISERLEKIDNKLGDVKDWSVRFGLLEGRITKLEEATAILEEIKLRLDKIETKLNT